MKNILRLIRLRQWVKNLFVLVPLFFGGALLNAEAVFAGIITLASFCFVASSIYCLNDIRDVEADRRHPVKCKRPIASGAVTIGQAYAFMIVMFALSLAVLFLLPAHQLEVGGVIVFYFVLNVAYCLKLKEYAIVDVCIVAFGFVLRILAGGVAAEVVLSKWIILMTFLLTLFLSFAKRRDDVLRMDETGIAPRKNTIRYNLTFINQAITITASVTLVCYIMYTVSPEVVANLHTENLYLTSVFVLVGLLRYIQIAVVDQQSGDPTKVILKDRFTQLVVLAWLISFLFIIYVA
ncbi:decaprenyl-phosphate phosphoribosyltransferase [Prevotella sp. KH2C16]|uniref:decaprenyl-phosphate phosphoribosyltransferase n=1 Tax=Prevotella sp. KH2C16 TaxID=1855325 RepID=UPI0008EAC903|nr:decaprenyl-phosphate phosphoribosyltransferase [Prevotella sp. KH2C16]SFG36112.1 4-hydroxybenzoate polyprenyltransferase [Prevotella sp. KH2C16]